MYALDTDTLSLYLSGHPAVTARMLEAPPQDIWISIVSVEETLRGRLNYIRDCESRHQHDLLVHAYWLLDASVRRRGQFQVSPFNAEAKAIYAGMPASLRKQGAQDCKTAAIAIAHGLIVVTRNSRHFGRIPGVRQEDWSL